MTRRRAPEPDVPALVMPAPAFVLETPPPLPRPRRAVTTLDPLRAAPALPTAGEPAGGSGVRRSWLEISEGTTLALHGTVIIGRAPTHPERYTHSLALPDQTRTLSRDHFVVGVTPTGQVWVSDQGSANGTYVSRGHTWARLTPNQRTPIADTDTVRFADFSLRVRTG